VSYTYLAAKNIVLVPITEAKRRKYPLIKRFAKLVNDQIIGERMIPRNSGARSLPLISQISSIMPPKIVKADLKGYGDYSIVFHRFNL
jgi:hypothetical protein